MKNHNVYLVSLTGHGDVEVGLVDKILFDWIDSDYGGESTSYMEDVPKNSISSEPMKITVTIGSYDNDRAIMCPKITFSSMKEVLAYCKQNNCTIVDEYHGAIY